jgi:hypothetical protein
MSLLTTCGTFFSTGREISVGSTAEAIGLFPIAAMIDRLADPAGQFTQRSSIDPVAGARPLGPVAYKSGFDQHLEMLRDRRLRHADLRNHLLDAAARHRPDVPEQPQPYRMRKRRELARHVLIALVGTVYPVNHRSSAIYDEVCRVKRGCRLPN